MQHKKVTLISAFLLGIVFSGVLAQTLFVKEKGGIQTSLALNDIRNLSFAEGNLLVSKTDGITDSYAINSIGYLSFTDYATSVSEQKLQQGNGILLYPNPAKDILHIRYETVIPGNMVIKIFDVHGRLVKQVATNNQGGTNHANIDVSGLPKGLYLFRTQGGSKTEIGRFVKD